MSEAYVGMVIVYAYRWQDNLSSRAAICEPLW